MMSEAAAAVECLALAAGTYIARGFLGMLQSRALLDSAKLKFGELACVSDAAQQVFVDVALAAPVPTVEKNDPHHMEGCTEIIHGAPMGGVASSYAARFLRLFVQEIEFALANLDDSTASSALVRGIHDMIVVAASSTCASARSRSLGFGVVAHDTAKTDESNSDSYSSISWITVFPSRSRDDVRLVFRSSCAFSDVGFRVWSAGLLLFDAVYPVEDSGGSDGDRVKEQHNVVCIREAVKGRVVLELGAGLGITAGALHAAGARGAILTDYCEPIVANLQQNLTANAEVLRGFDVRAELLDVVCTDEAALRAYAQRAEVFVGADVTYDPALIEAMVSALERLVDYSDNSTPLDGSFARCSHLGFSGVLTEGSKQDVCSMKSGSSFPCGQQRGTSRCAFLFATKRSEETWSLLQQALVRRRQAGGCMGSGRTGWHDVTAKVIAESSHALEYLTLADAASSSLSAQPVYVFLLTP